MELPQTVSCRLCLSGSVQGVGVGLGGGGGLRGNDLDPETIQRDSRVFLTGSLSFFNDGFILHFYWPCTDCSRAL